MDTPYDFYIKHNMCAVEWRLKAMIKKTKVQSINLIKLWDIFWMENLKIMVFNY